MVTRDLWQRKPPCPRACWVYCLEPYNITFVPSLTLFTIHVTGNITSTSRGLDNDYCAILHSTLPILPSPFWNGQGESDCLIKTKHCDGW